SAGRVSLFWLFRVREHSNISLLSPLSLPLFLSLSPPPLSPSSLSFPSLSLSFSLSPSLSLSHTLKSPPCTQSLEPQIHFDCKVSNFSQAAESPVKSPSSSSASLSQLTQIPATE